MAFWGDYFIFDGIPCTEYGLRLYEVNGVSPVAVYFQARFVVVVFLYGELRDFCCLEEPGKDAFL